jgi:hypothetical protein
VLRAFILEGQLPINAPSGKELLSAYTDQSAGQAALLEQAAAAVATVSSSVEESAVGEPSTAAVAAAAGVTAVSGSSE